MQQSKHLLPECVDIILVTHQRLHFLKKSVDYIKERTRWPHRLIVVDNASSDGTRDYLKRMEKVGIIDVVVCLNENVGQAHAQNIGLEHVKTKYFVITQDDLLCPDMKPCWLERLVHMMEKHDDYGALCPRIERTRRLEWDENNDIIRSYKSMPATFRIHRTEEILSLGKEPFGRRKHWESPECAKMMQGLKKKYGFVTHLYCSHEGFMAENKGYIGGYDRYYTYSIERVKQGEDKPYPTIDFRSLIPLKINHPVDTEEHNKRLKYWHLDTGITTEGISNRKTPQRAILAEYVGKHGGKSVDLGCGAKKCHPDQIGIDIYPYENVDIVHDSTDLWFFKDCELDSISASHHLEHVADPKAVLREWNRTLKLGGLLCLIVPDGDSRPSTIREPSHKSAFTIPVLEQLIYRVLGHKIIKMGFVPGLAENKKSIICISKKR
jgi:glycosyltransferase involved in cell wall biosynthesis/uncharacterized protein YneR